MVQQADFHGVSVPYLPAIQIECEAEALLSAFAKRFSAITEPPVPAQEIASRLLGLRIESLDLKRAFPDSDAHGAMWFRQRKVVIDQSLDPRRAPANRFRYRFALAHELGHWQLHRRQYLENQTEQRLWERGLVGPDIVCRSTRKDFMGAHELAFYGWKEGAGHKFYGPNNATDLWHVKKIPPQQLEHLTGKPAELAVRSIQYSSLKGHNVLDLFGGSGSTLIGAEQTGRRAFLMELDQAYCDVIVDRYQAAPTLSVLAKQQIVADTRSKINSKATAVNAWLDAVDLEAYDESQLQEYCDTLLASHDGNPVAGAD